MRGEGVRASVQVAGQGSLGARTGAARTPAAAAAKPANVRVNGIPSALRGSLYVVATGLWLSGCSWLVLHLYFQTPTQFGAQPHAWEPPLLLVHGLLAAPALYLFGWISARHAVDGWRMARRRASGGVLFVALAVLALSGFGLYYATGDLTRATIAFVHELLGVACLVPALLHWPAPSKTRDKTEPGAVR
jgi:hypothetical protein